MSDSVRPHRRQPTRLPRPWDSPGKNTGVGFHFLLQCMKVKSESEVAQSRPTLSDPMDCSLPGFSIHVIFQAKVLEWGAIAFSLLLTTPGQLHTSPTSAPVTGMNITIFLPFCFLFVWIRGWGGHQHEFWERQHILGTCFPGFLWACWVLTASISWRPLSDGLFHTTLPASTVSPWTCSPRW